MDQQISRLDTNTDDSGQLPNHVGAAIARHKRTGRIEERDNA